MCSHCGQSECIHQDAAELFGPWAFLDSLDARPTDPPPLAPWPLLSDYKRGQLFTD